MTIDSILTGKYYEVFDNDSEKIRKTYRDLVKKFHPDVCSDSRASEAIAKLQLLYKEAEDHYNSNSWKESNVVTFHRDDGKKAIIKNYKYQTSNEMGRVWVASSCICYEFVSSKKKYFDNFLVRATSFRYANAEMKSHFSYFLPTILDHFQADSNYYIIIKNYPELYPLDLVKEVFKKPEHAAWLTTKILDICNFLQFSNLSHNGICAENCFINLEMHSVHLLGGWQYSVPLSDKLIGMPKKVFDNVKLLITDDKRSQNILDLSAAKDLVRDASNGSSYIKLTDQGFNPLFVDFLFKKPEEDSFEEYSIWEDVRHKVWPEHKFIKVSTPTDIWK